MSECYCDYDFESPSLYSKETRKARKQHRCQECAAPIKSGEKYERVAELWDGCWNVYKTCQNCTGLREYVQAHVPCFCWAHGNIVEDAIETARNYTREAPGLLFGAYRFQILSRRARQSAKKGIECNQ